MRMRFASSIFSKNRRIRFNSSARDAPGRCDNDNEDEEYRGTPSCLDLRVHKSALVDSLKMTNPYESLQWKDDSD